jgi:hypothetical protein
VAGNKNYKIVKSIEGKNKLQYEYWVDTSRRSSIIKIRIHERGHVSGQIEIQHQKIDWGWVPSSWTCNVFLLGEDWDFDHSESYFVKKAQINPTVEKKDFQGKFTPDMVVRDVGENKLYQANAMGELKEVSAEDLMRQHGFSSWKNFLFILLITLSFFLALYIVWRRIRSKRFKRKV